MSIDTLAPEVLMPEVDFAADPVFDLEDRLAVLRETGRRIVPIKWKGTRAWVVLQYKDVFELLGDDLKIPAAPEYLRNWDTQGDQPLKMEGAAHRASRNVLEPPFKISQVRRMVDSLLVPLADKLIDDFGDRRELDLVSEFTRRYTFLVIARILGIEISNDRNDENELIRLIYALLQGGQIPGADTPEARRRSALGAVAQMNDFLRQTIEARKREPKNDLISALIHAEEGGSRISEEKLYDYVRFVFPAGAETTHTAIGRLMKNVLSDLSIRDRLLANPTERPAAVLESLRFTPASNLVPRTLVKDTLLCDVTIPGGSTVLMAVTSGNHDPTVFTNPSVYSLDEKRKPILSFGVGPHHCLGHHLAKAEMETSLGRLLERLPGLRLAEPPPPAMGTVFRWLPKLQVKFDDIRKPAR